MRVPIGTDLGAEQFLARRRIDEHFAQRSLIIALHDIDGEIVKPFMGDDQPGYSVAPDGRHHLRRFALHPFDARIECVRSGPDIDAGGLKPSDGFIVEVSQDAREQPPRPSADVDDGERSRLAKTSVDLSDEGSESLSERARLSLGGKVAFGRMPTVEPLVMRGTEMG